MTTTKTTIKVPKPTAWPLVAAFGLTLTFAGFLTSYLVGIIGGILSVIGFIGWFKDRFPNNLEITVEVETDKPELSVVDNTDMIFPVMVTLFPATKWSPILFDKSRK